jgi:predicted secreted protein
MNHVTQGGWQQYLPQSGMQSLRIEAAGRFSDSAAETSLRQQAFSGEIKNYQLVFGNGDSLTGSFKIQHYQRQGDYFSEETYRFTLESSGEVVYISE